MSNQNEHSDSMPPMERGLLHDAVDDNTPAVPAVEGGADRSHASAQPLALEQISSDGLSEGDSAPAAAESPAENERKRIGLREAAEGQPVVVPTSASNLFQQPSDDVTLDEPVDLKGLIRSDYAFDLDEDFDKLMEADSARQAAVFAEIVQRTVRRSLFTGFLAPTHETRAPFSIRLSTVEASILHQLVTAILPNKPTRQSALRLLLTDSRLTVQSNELVTVLQHGIDFPSGTGVEHGKEAVFYISAWDFDKAFRAANGEVSLSWSGGDVLTFQSGHFERDIALPSVQHFTPFADAPISLLSEGGFSLSALQEAMTYAQPLIEEFRRNAPEPAIIEVRADGTFCAGAPGALCVTRDPQLAGCTLSLRGDRSKALEAAVKYLQEPVHIFADGRHHILWDGATAIGWDRSIRDLGDVNRLEDMQWGPAILVPRPELTYSITHVQNLSGGDSLQIFGKGFGKLQLTLSAESQANRRASRRVEAYAPAAILPNRVTVPIWPLLSALRGSDSINVAMRRVGAWIAVDDRDTPPKGSCFYIAGSTGER